MIPDDVIARLAPHVRRVAILLNSMNPQQFRESLVNAGILDVRGRLTRRYRSRPRRIGKLIREMPQVPTTSDPVPQFERDQLIAQINRAKAADPPWIEALRVLMCQAADLMMPPPAQVLPRGEIRRDYGEAAD